MSLDDDRHLRITVTLDVEGADSDVLSILVARAIHDLYSWPEVIEGVGDSGQEHHIMVDDSVVVARIHFRNWYRTPRWRSGRLGEWDDQR